MHRQSGLISPRLKQEELFLPLFEMALSGHYPFHWNLGMRTEEQSSVHHQDYKIKKAADVLTELAELKSFQAQKAFFDQLSSFEKEIFFEVFLNQVESYELDKLNYLH